MPDALQTEKALRLVGVKQVSRALRHGSLRRVYLARSADPKVTEPIALQCAETDVPVIWVTDGRELGRSCDIAVPCAVAALRCAP